MFFLSPSEACDNCTNLRSRIKFAPLFIPLVCISLISCLCFGVVRQVEKRFTAEQLLKHPFIQTACPEAEFAAYVKKMLAKKRR